MKYKRYKVNLGLFIRATTKKEAYRMIKEIIESGEAVSDEGIYNMIKMKAGYSSKSIEMVGKYE